MAADNLRERNSRRKMLRAIKKSLEQLTSPYISRADLRQLGIQQLWMSMSLEKEPLFFRPYNAPIQPPEIDTLTDYYPEFDESPFRNAENLGWYLNQYFQNCTLPKQDLNPPGSSYTYRPARWRELHAVLRPCARYAISASSIVWHIQLALVLAPQNRRDRRSWNPKGGDPRAQRG
ncbi:hypothetical protein BDBG_06433 [Blastomyces gilchristii SLH14081]|uniref:Uncharacterized protein n=1 Tax=Blastomyces gilchristii (strain SLH14081) TaxID=559298 RepID=A0A179URG9_BLAGS|nr:uncharacterized protein BDBG_06433 [Blastomyces gilchristii SLH14081]OAT10614.1 hypothetical protein BDBG_06433 [Blastomyces gilchristii SLH14081]